MQDPGAGFDFFPLIVRLVRLSTDMHVAQFFCLQGLVCLSLFPRARFLILTSLLSVEVVRLFALPRAITSVITL